ncbi:hypothetical protein GF322_00575 [Candidatus Dependentiae bacterium]|nr:hypothetical protein [Candidatus Dependentiae bacterium]
MKKKLILFLMIAIFNNHSLRLVTIDNKTNSDMAFSILNQIQQHEKIKILSIILNDQSFLSKVAKIIQFDLEFADQLEMQIKKSNNFLNKNIETKLCNKGFSLLLYLSKTNDNIKLTLKDLNSESIIIDKEFIFDQKNKILSIHKISDELIKILTGEESVTLSSIAYCKLVSPKQKVICLSDYAGKKEKIIIPQKTINVAPCWHSQAPVLFYSQFTKRNNRLMSINLETKQNKIICSYDGLNMQPSFSPDGKKAVLCLSGGKNSELYLYDYNLCKKYNKRVFVPITKNCGNNSSPHLLENGDIIFCSDYQTGYPQIYYYKKAKKTIKRLTSGHGYCAAPSYCPKTNNIVYTRIVNGTFQLFTLNLDNFKNIVEKQITFGPGDKHEPSFSPCGNFIAFSYDFPSKNPYKVAQIAALNCNSGNIRVLTSNQYHKSYPRWVKNAFY